MIFNARFDTSYAENDSGGAGIIYPVIVGTECKMVGALVSKWGDKYGVVLRLDFEDGCTDTLLSEEDSEEVAIILAEKINKILGEGFRKAKNSRGVLILHIKDVIDVVALSEEAMKEVDDEAKAGIEEVRAAKNKFAHGAPDERLNPNPFENEDSDDEDNEDSNDQ